MKGNQLFDHEKFNFTIARLKKNGETFEIVVEDADKALAFRSGAKIEVSDIVQSEKIYSSANHGMLAAEAEFQSFFGTDNTSEICAIILKDGELHLTAEYKAKLREDKKKQIIYSIHKNCIDPRTNAPHTIARIDATITELKIKIDEFKSPMDQMKTIITQLSSLLPMKFENKKYSIKIFSQHSEHGMALVRRYTKPLDMSWNDDGSVVCIIEVSPGVAAELIDALNKLTKGGVNIDELS
jgi:ribosome maturation protein SDO1